MGNWIIAPSAVLNLMQNTKREIQKRNDLGDPKVPLIQIHEHDPFWVKIAKRPIQVAQLIFYSIIAFLIYLTTIFAH
jgi:hypothetical protein